jgi:hypothetical protein
MEGPARSLGHDPESFDFATIHDAEKVLPPRGIGLNYEGRRPMAITKRKVPAHSFAHDSESFNSATICGAEKVLPPRRIGLNYEGRRHSDYKRKVPARSLAHHSESFNSATIRGAEKVLPSRHISLNYEDRRPKAIINGRSLYVRSLTTSNKVAEPLTLRWSTLAMD